MIFTTCEDHPLCAIRCAIHCMLSTTIHSMLSAVTALLSSGECLPFTEHYSVWANTQARRKREREYKFHVFVPRQFVEQVDGYSFLVFLVWESGRGGERCTQQTRAPDPGSLSPLLKSVPWVHICSKFLKPEIFFLIDPLLGNGRVCEHLVRMTYDSSNGV